MRNRARLALEAAAEPPAGEGVHAYPPERTRKRAQRSGDPHVIGGGGVERV